MALLKDLIEIPERVHQGDFVLKLADGVVHAEATVSLRDFDAGSLHGDLAPLLAE